MFFTKQMIQLGSIGFAVVLLGLLYFGVDKNNRMASLEVSFLDVGQGDAILINYLHRYQILIDSGASGKKVLTELSKVMPFMDDKIEVVIVTHPDRDHFAGFIDVLKKYEVDLIFDNGQDSDDEVWQEFQKIIIEKGISKQVITEGSTIKIGDGRSKNSVEFNIFNPDEIVINKKEKNESSIVVRMDYGKNSFLFTGDAGFSAEIDMIFDKEKLDVDFLKVGHHGSRYSSSDFFLARVTPEWSIISVGENDYGHPTEEALGRLRKIGSRILRTDELGTIVIGCDKDCVVK
jgi:competence protein ComEC